MKIIAAQNIRVSGVDVIAGDEIAEFNSPHDIYSVTQMLRQGQAEFVREEVAPVEPVEPSEPVEPDQPSEPTEVVESPAPTTKRKRK